MRIALASVLLISTLLVPAPAMAMTSAPAPVTSSASSTTMGFGICILFPGLPWCPK